VSSDFPFGRRGRCLDAIRFLVLANLPIEADIPHDFPLLRPLFPSLRLCLLKQARITRWPYGERLQACELRLYAPVKCETLAYVCGNVRGTSTDERSDEPVPERISKVTVGERGGIICSAPLSSTRFHILRTMMFNDRVSIEISCDRKRNGQEDLSMDLFRLLQLVLPDWSSTDVSFVVHINCAHTVLPDIMACVSSWISDNATFR
jgi:hypothetical protein